MGGKMTGRGKWVLLLALLTGLSACESRREVPEPEISTPAPRVVNEQAAQELSRAFWEAGEAAVSDAQGALESLERAVVTLLDSPSEDHLEAAKLAWLEAHRGFAAALPYMRVAFAPAPLQSEGRALQLALDSWPVQPGYLDTVPGYSDSGIVNDTAIDLTLANLRKQHRLTAHEEASTGFHAMEVMLWGPTGERTAGEFKAVSEGEKPEALAVNRRRELTRLIGRAMAEDMDGLARRWPATANDLSRHYLALRPAERLQQVRSAHIAVVDEELLRRLPESSESDVESPRAADSKQAMLAMLAVLRDNWVPAEGGGLAELLLDRHQAAALTQTFAQLEALMLKMEDPVELAELRQLAQARELMEQLAGLMSGSASVPADDDEMTPVSLPPED
ncbi:imelysin family protein [Microbulbifer thermotolerans]|uniref:imelysin family protein n=1 Tax=Microbulbifer thermotolerans TaxID=252514 RepID=UPI00224B4B50|nr:imelysin family protein [Microbulbifer thermotolerans]MCX2778177.1 imelysin family protein [Microbulbifer thermotolerans]MCX2804525.1 imelysin family protein [Microbulbifer thermotolerans]